MLRDDMQRLGLGMERSAVTLAPPSPLWAEAYAVARRTIAAAEPRLALLHHVGSTAIPGIHAKPILDLLGVAAGDLDGLKPALAALGFEWKGEYGIAGRRYCVLYDESGTRGLIHLHVFAARSPEIARHLAFRDALRASPRLAREYEALKLTLAAENAQDRAAYTDAKGGLIKRILATPAVVSPMTRDFGDFRPRTVRSWEPAPGTRRGQGRFLLLHGMESHAGWFEGLGAELARRGYPAVAFDRRGFGGSGGERGDAANEYMVLSEVDLARLSLIPDGEPAHLVGMSWGGLLAAHAAMDTLHPFASIALLAPALFPTRKLSPLGYAKALVALTGFRLPAALPLVPADFTKALEKQAFVTDDPWRVKEVTGRFLLVTWRLQQLVRHLAPRVAARLILLAGDDAVIDNRRTARFAEKKGYAVATLAGAAHSLALEDPAWVAAQLVAHALQAEGAQ